MAQDNKSSMDIVAGNGIEFYEITVQSNSDVSCTYSIYLSNLPDSIRVALDSETFKTPENGEIVFENVGEFHILDGVTSRIHQLAFKANIESNELVDNNVEVKVIFNQIN